MRAFGSFVGGAIKSLRAKKAVEFHRLKQAWMEAVGPLVAGQAEPVRIKGNILYVVVSSPQWSQEISFQQRLILTRLGKSLGKAPKKIVCFVGKPHSDRRENRAKNHREEPEENEEWRLLDIPEERQRGIDATLATIENEHLKKRMKSILEHAVRKEMHQIAKGLLPCPLCGAFRPPEDETCDRCERERRQEGERKILRMLARKPWLTAKEVMDYHPWVTQALFMKLRKTLRTDWLQQTWQLAEGKSGAELAELMSPKLRTLMLDITMLSCSLAATSLQARHFHFSLGKRLANAYLGKEEEPPPAED